MRIVVSVDKVEVVVPLKIGVAKVHEFIRDKERWIRQTLDELAKRRPPGTRFLPADFTADAEVYYQGRPYPIKLKPTRLKTLKIIMTDSGCFDVAVPESLSGTDYRQQLKAAFTVWLKKQALLKVQELVAQHAPHRQLWPQRIAIKTQRSRWGSCSARNNININWLLILAPPEILEYVVVHELCHIRVKNHSRDFWALVAEHLPDYKTARVWLKSHGSQLMQVLID